MIIPYQRIDYPTGTRYFPILDLEILFPGRELYLTKALVDSGSERSLFAKEILDDSGIDVSSYPRGLGSGAGGVRLQTIFLPVFVRILGKRIRLDTNWMTMEPGSFNLLGRYDFFNKFRVIFDEPRRLMEIVPHEER